MTSVVPAAVTPKTANLSPGSKRRRLMPLSPTNDSSQRYDVAPEVQMPSIPSLSKIDGSFDLPPATNRPRRRTESFDGAFCFDPAFVSPTPGQVCPRSNSNADHCIDHNSFNKRRPPFTAKESDTFAAFTKPAEGSSFGASSSFVGLRGLLPDDARASQNSLAEASRLLMRNSSSVGLDMNKADDDFQPELKKEE
mmetsp:Transcript_41043/g.98949  ORF Transcript_41043/g.98949 Transcript_41043/m.98949 type:complete len:195 (+) Transcript_41043:281-865(+)|eukprot:CAMPEP_0113601208 /NCGR_PEP_ID=MMETSP0017_2-20120614/108_1 /TAXON_ID=2856 /ORGANISM="Cylindrotheca closterium" /LENGTH=194 /DNA_ID=CAMNT_0000509489 /DNA_START=148 /DNA_END=732 /DNA_ORIENTATION=+ /assembly_acc=CAM_ASM_000147